MPPLVDDFFEEIALRRKREAGSVLRSVGSLEGSAIQLLADVLDDEHHVRRFFPYRLALVPRPRAHKGRPPKIEKEPLLLPPELGASAFFFECLNAGNSSKAVEALRNISRLDGLALGLLCDLFEDSPGLTDCMGLQLVLEQRKAGAPATTLSDQAQWNGVALSMRKILAEVNPETGKPLNNLKRALHKVSSTIGKSRSTILHNLKASPFWKKPKKSKIKNSSD